MADEIWKQVPGYNHLFASSLGRIKAGARQVKITYSDPDTGESNVQLIRRVDKILSPTLKRNGYYHIYFQHLNIKQELMVHRLVALAFVDGWFPNATVDHIDCDRSNNRASNLQWLTRSANAKRAHTHGKATRRGPENNKFKLPYSEYPAIFEKRASGMKYKDIASEYGVSEGLIGHILTGRRKAPPLTL